MIYIHPVGGLGNMMFHIASIYSLAKDNGDELCLVNIEDKINNLKSDTRIDLKHCDQYRYLFDRFTSMDKKGTPCYNHPFAYYPIPYKEEHEYIGYFQCEIYFKHHKEEIINIFRPDDSHLDRINKYSSLFGNISIHIRRNDYVHTQWAHPLQPIDYYNKALGLLPDNIVCVFSDDVEWCKENFTSERFVIIDEIDYISLYIMSKMKYHIIANSSFSWWGAWMSNWKKVIAPAKWFGDRFMTSKDIVPETWIRI